jgi:hypothetical protein
MILAAMTGSTARGRVIVLPPLNPIYVFVDPTENARRRGKMIDIDERLRQGDE